MRLMLCLTAAGALIAAVFLTTEAESMHSERLTVVPMKPPPLTVSGTAVTQVSSFAPTQITCSGVTDSTNSIACAPAQGPQRIGQPGDNY